MRAAKGADTAPELAIRSALHRRGLRYRVDWKLPHSRRRADLAFVRARVAVFVDGCFWHACPIHATWPKANAAWWRAKLLANRRRDRDTDLRLRRAGWLVLRFWEHEVAERAARTVTKAVRARRLQLERTAGRT